MKILLIGGTGRLSKDTTLLCLEKGYDIYLFNRGHRNDIKHENIHYIVGDINDYENAKKILQDETFDVVIDYLVYSLDALVMRLKLFDKKIKQYAFISSATVFPVQNAVISEKSPIGNDGWSYSREKRLCEVYLKEHKDEFSFKYTIIRPYVTYDRTRIPFPVISKVSNWNLIDRMQKGLPLIIPGDGNQKVTMTSSKDFAVALAGLLMNPEAFGEDYNLVGDAVATWNDVIAAVEKAINKKAELVYADPEKVAKRIPTLSEELLYDKGYSHIFDNTKIKKAVPGFISKVSVEEGIKETVEFLMNTKTCQIYDAYWNSMENVLCNHFSDGHYKMSAMDYYRYFKAQSRIVNAVRNIIHK